MCDRLPRRLTGGSAESIGTKGHSAELSVKCSLPVLSVPPPALNLEIVREMEELCQ
jgi:hypothetical protein